MTKDVNKLTGKQARYLRGLGHSLKPIVRVGKSGVTASLLRQIRQSLEVHELIKIKLIQSAPSNAKQIGDSLSKEVPCHLAQVIGKTVLLYKPSKDKPQIVLPE